MLSPLVVGLALAANLLMPTSARTAEPSVNWDGVIRCESGGNPRAQNPHSSASGLFQFLDSTWRANGGGKYARRAKDATPSQQYEIANVLYSRAGLRPWAASRSCWSGGATRAASHRAPAKHTARHSVKRVVSRVRTKLHSHH